MNDLFRKDLCTIPYTPMELGLFFVACLVVCALIDRIASSEDADT